MAKKKTHVMVAYSGEMTDVLRDVLRDHLSPEAVAAMAAHLAPAAGKRNKVAREAAWFRRLLIDMVGADEFDRMCEQRTW